MARSTKPAWRTDRIRKDIDPDTGRHIVDLPTLKGVKADLRDALFAFEAENIGTFRATIRMNKRAQGDDLGHTPYRLAKAGIPKGLASFYSEDEG